MQATEYEIKHLGKYNALLGLANTFNNKVNAVLDRTYDFRTDYLDKDNALQNAGFSLRYRPNVEFYDESFELKAIDGDVNGISARLEIDGRGGATTQETYDRLLNHPNWPDGLDKHKLEDLDLMFSTVVTRREIQANLELTSGRALIEFCFDDIVYENSDGKPCGFENEAELEIKKMYRSGKQTPATADDMQEVLDWYKSFEQFNSPDIVMHTVSKAARARRYVFV